MAQQHLPIIRDVHSIRTFRESLQGPVALIPTMGMLHDGHLSLVRLAAQQTASIIVSIYANPSQLTSAGESQSYPSTLNSDLEILTALNSELRRNRSGTIQAIFAPNDQEMYPCSSPDSIPRGVGCFVNILPLTSLLEGVDRPSHFVGVATVCLKLFNAVKPNKVYLGEKDFQQTIIVKRLVQELLLDVEVVVGKTFRESDGLALSSRNVFLGTRRRAIAPVIVRALHAAREAYEKNELDKDELIHNCKRVAEEEQVRQKHLSKEQRTTFTIIYFDLADIESFETISNIDPERGAVLCGAIQILPLEGVMDGEDRGLHDGVDSVRLLDSIVLEPRKAKGSEPRTLIA